MPLLDGRDEPLRRVDLVLHELNGLLVLLPDPSVRTHHFADHLHIAAVDAHLGNVVGVQREVEPPVLIVEDEVGDDVGRRVGSALGIEVAGLGRQVPDLGDGLAEIVLGNLQARHQFFVMLLDELVEIAGQNLPGQPPRTGVDRHLRHLQQQAFAQVARADARRLAAALGVPLRELELDVLCEDAIAANPAERCYFCKRRIFGAICAAAAADGYPVVLDGTNASDDRGDRPGMRALEQAHVLSPLRLCGLTKAEVRRRSKAAGLFTWDKPAYACLATRVPTGEPITAEKLRAVERSEAFLFALGFTDLRVRLRDGGALLQLPAAQHAAARARWPEITAGLSEYFSTIQLDPKARAESE